MIAAAALPTLLPLMPTPSTAFQDSVQVAFTENLLQQLHIPNILGLQRSFPGVEICVE